MGKIFTSANREQDFLLFACERAIIASMDSLVLCPIFLSHLPGSQLRPAFLTETAEQALEATWEAGRATWPDINLPAPLFVQHLAERSDEITDEAALLAALGRLHATDLFLACACTHQVESAIRHFDREFIRRVPAFVAKLRLQPSFVEDVQQELRQRLLVGNGEAPPGISAYGGRGRLSSWLGAVAVRAAISEGRSKDEQCERTPDIAERIADVAVDPAIESMKRRYRVEFKRAIEQAIAELSGEQRNLLRHYYVKGFTTTQVGALFNMNQSSASRRLSSIRETLFSEVKRLLRERLKLSDSDFCELAGLVQSQLTLSLSQVFQESADPSEGSRSSS